ncbi:MerC domain-containing protein [Tenacibaculum amylolyticum]|uniref:MerC domain-containing protein n=1 Tax=Tenacibaculum amylolyticum TaxID=104269 RepID=UPI0038965282
MVLSQKSDLAGILASSLCLVHCIFTPFLFVAQTQMACCEAVPGWWGSIDYLFLAISFFAIYKSTKTTTKNWVKISFWLSWTALSIIIVNEHFGWFHLVEESIYVPALALIFLHFYNIKYCQCSGEKCCSSNQ